MINLAEPPTIEARIALARQRLADLLDDEREVRRMLTSRDNYLGMAHDKFKEASRYIKDAQVCAALPDCHSAQSKLDLALQKLSEADGYIRLASGEDASDGG